MTTVYNRKTKEYEEIKHYGSNALTCVYSNKLITNIAINKFISKLYGLYNASKISKNKIPKFIEDNKIDMKLYKKQEYNSFNDFFIRDLKKLNITKKGFISPCQSKLSVYKITKDLKVTIKNQEYKISELTNEELDYKNGYIFIYRLSVDNYHKFHYIDDGKRIKRVRIKGKLHTVSEYSEKYKIYKENEREYSILDTKHFGQIIYMEVGALLIGRIINHDLDTFKRGEEKGYFLPGGSTVIIIANNIKVDKDILNNSKNNIETLVDVGEKVGE